jgi:uncharacterized protein YbbC (DUF1343 family)
MPIKFGIDVLLSSEPEWKNKRIGMLTNDAAKTNIGILSRLALNKAGFNLVKLFSPEHGIQAIGADGALMQDGIDSFTQLPITSLYGTRFMPTALDLEGIDIMLFDVPDAGTRFYTYLWSMSYWIEAAAKYNKQVVILDRPNPLGGQMDRAEGPMLEDTISSFIGRFNIPIKHQCTLGELANYFNQTQSWHANLNVIPCEGWQRPQLFYDWHLPWVNPSPALQNIEATILYPGLCFFEATNVSLGRGTKYSFEWIGAEWININSVKMACQHVLGEDLKIEILKLSIAKDGIKKEIEGLRFKVIDPQNYDAVMTGLLLLKVIKDIHPNNFKWTPYPTQANPTGNHHLNLLLGISNAEELFDLPLQQWLQQIGKMLKVTQWETTIASYLLYT